MIFKLKLVIFFVFLSSPLLWAQGEQADEVIGGVPQGMEELQITPGHKLFVPQGAKINRVGAHITVEEDQEYFSRRFYEITQQIQALTEQIKMLQAQVDELKGKSSDQTIMKSN